MAEEEEREEKVKETEHMKDASLMDKELSVLDELVLRKPDDFHLHLRDGAEKLRLLVPHACRQVARAIAMPNLIPPVRTVKDAQAYRDRLLEHVPKGATFEPLMTLYLTDNTTTDEIRQAKESGFVYACKLYPKGFFFPFQSAKETNKHIKKRCYDQFR